MAALAAISVEDSLSPLDPARLMCPWDPSQEPLAPVGGFIDVLRAPPGQFFQYVHRLLLTGTVFRGRFTFPTIAPTFAPGGRIVIPVPAVVGGMDRHESTPHPELHEVPSQLAVAAALLRSTYGHVASNLVGGTFPRPGDIRKVMAAMEPGHLIGLWEWYMFNREVVAHLVAAVRSHLPALGPLGARLHWELLPHNLDAMLGRALGSGPFTFLGLPSTVSTPVVPLASILIARLYTLRLPPSDAPVWPRHEPWLVPTQCPQCRAPLTEGLLSCPRCDIGGRQEFVVQAFCCPTCSNVSGWQKCPVPECRRQVGSLVTPESVPGAHALASVGIRALEGMAAFQRSVTSPGPSGASDRSAAEWGATVAAARLAASLLDSRRQGTPAPLGPIGLPSGYEVGSQVLILSGSGAGWLGVIVSLEVTGAVRLSLPESLRSFRQGRLIISKALGALRPVGACVLLAVGRRAAPVPTIFMGLAPEGASPSLPCAAASAGAGWPAPPLLRFDTAHGPIDIVLPATRDESCSARSGAPPAGPLRPTPELPLLVDPSLGAAPGCGPGHAPVVFPRGRLQPPLHEVLAEGVRARLRDVGSPSWSPPATEVLHPLIHARVGALVDGLAHHSQVGEFGLRAEASRLRVHGAGPPVLPVVAPGGAAPPALRPHGVPEELVSALSGGCPVLPVGADDVMTLVLQQLNGHLAAAGRPPLPLSHGPTTIEQLRQLDAWARTSLFAAFEGAPPAARLSDTGTAITQLVIRVGAMLGAREVLAAMAARPGGFHGGPAVIQAVADLNGAIARALHPGAGSGAFLREAWPDGFARIPAGPGGPGAAQREWLYAVSFPVVAAYGDRRHAHELVRCFSTLHSTLVHDQPTGPAEDFSPAPLPVAARRVIALDDPSLPELGDAPGMRDGSLGGGHASLCARGLQ